MSSAGPSGARSSGVIRRTVTEQEIAEAVKAGANPYDYTFCREAGATHAEVLEALGAGADLFYYAYCRKTGATHPEVLEALGAGADLGWYSYCLEAGASHAEVLKALGAGADLVHYSICRRVGATHSEAMALRLRGAGPDTTDELKLAVPALRAACDSTPTRELGETIATLAQDWAGTADELAATAVALLSTRAR